MDSQGIEGLLKVALNGFNELLRRENKALKRDAEEILIRNFNDLKMKTRDTIYEKLSDTLFKGFLKCASDGYTFVNEVRIKDKLGTELEEYYPSSTGTAFLNFSKTYWTLKILLDDLSSNHEHTTLYNLLSSVERDISKLFFPAFDKTRNNIEEIERTQRRIISESGAKIDIDEFISRNPLLIPHASDSEEKDDHNESPINRDRINAQIAKNRKTKLLKIFLLTIVLGLITFFGSKYYQHYNTRYIRQAEARLNTDDREGAIDAYRSHIFENRNDYLIQLKLASLLRETGKIRSSARIYNRILNNLSIKTEFPHIYSKAAYDLQELLSDSIADIKRRIDNEIEEKGYKSALELQETIIALCAASPYLKASYLVADDTSAYDDLKLRNAFAIWDYENAIAKKAFIQWLAGDSDGAEFTVVYQFLAPINYISFERDNREHVIRSYFAAYLSEYANEMFDKKKWADASRMFSYAREQKLIASNGEYDDEIGRLLYNEAISEYNRGGYWKSKELLRELKRNLPDFEAGENIDRIIGQANQLALFDKARNMWKKGTEAFEKKNWIAAVGAFKEYTDYLIAKGYPKSSELVLDGYYNMAMAYWNDRQYEKARGILKGIKEINSDYRALEISEDIEKLDSFVGYHY